jgi:hypothetical protein
MLQTAPARPRQRRHRNSDIRKEKAKLGEQEKSLGQLRMPSKDL